MEDRIYPGVVAGYPQEADKGLLEVALGALAEGADVVYALPPMREGVYWLPERGARVEVLLPCALGEPARVLGVRYAPEDALVADSWTEENDVKRVRTRAGNEAVLSDKAEETGVRLSSAGGLFAALSDKERQLTLSDEAGENTLLLDAEQGSLTLTAAKKLTLRCGGASIELDEDGNVTITAKGELRLAGQAVAAAAQDALKLEGQQARLAGKLKTEVSGDGGLELSSSAQIKAEAALIQLN